MTRPLEIKVYSESGELPEYATPGAACFDIKAYITNSIKIYPGDSAIIKTGLYFDLPDEYVLKLYSRSGHGFKHGVSLANSVGIADQDYKGEIQLKIINHGPNPFVIENGDRIAQGMIEKVLPVNFIQLNSKADITRSERGENGFGSTGVK